MRIPRWSPCCRQARIVVPTRDACKCKGSTQLTTQAQLARFVEGPHGAHSGSSTMSARRVRCEVRSSACCTRTSQDKPLSHGGIPSCRWRQLPGPWCPRRGDASNGHDGVKFHHDCSHNGSHAAIGRAHESAGVTIPTTVRTVLRIRTRGCKRAR